MLSYTLPGRWLQSCRGRGLEKPYLCGETQNIPHKCYLCVPLTLILLYHCHEPIGGDVTHCGHERFLQPRGTLAEEGVARVVLLKSRTVHMALSLHCHRRSQNAGVLARDGFTTSVLWAAAHTLIHLFGFAPLTPTQSCTSRPLCMLLIAGLQPCRRDLHFSLRRQPISQIHIVRCTEPSLLGASILRVSVR